MTTEELNAIASQVAAILKSAGDDISNLAEDTTYPFYAIGYNDNGNLRKSNLGNLAKADDVNNAKIAVFVDLWKDAVGGYGNYDESTGLFSLNGLTNITYAQAVGIYNQTNNFMSNNQTAEYASASFRTNIPEKSVYQSALKTDFTLTRMFRDNRALEKVSFPRANAYTSRPYIKPTSIVECFAGCSALTEIDVVIDCSDCTSFSNTFSGCSSLTTMSLHNIKADVNLSACVNISHNSLEIMLQNSANTDSITITVSATVYDKIFAGNWSDLLTLATSKNIYFVSA